MRRREFLGIVGGVAAWPIAARAQQMSKVHRVGLFFSTSPVSEMAGPDPIHPYARVFVHALHDLEYVEGRNLILERRLAEGKFERFPEIIRDLVSINVDVIVTVTDPMTLSAKEVTRTVPIVAIKTDPVEKGLIQSLASPGDNVTGPSGGTGPENNAKRIQLLKELVPGMSRAVFLQHKVENPTWAKQAAEAAERALGVKVLFAEQTDYAEAFAFIADARADALIVGGGGRNFGNRHLIVEFAAKNRLPAIYSFPEYVRAGGLIAYGADLVDVWRRAAGYVDRILKGAKPANLPVEQPSKYRIVINLKTAKALGLTIPQPILLRADEVIE